MVAVEVESRGKLDARRYTRLKIFFSKNAKSKTSDERLTILYFREAIPKKSRDIRKDPVDLRLRITGKTAELVLKHGAWGGSDMRKEYRITLDMTQFTDTMAVLAHLGWRHCVIYANTKTTYIFKGVEFTLVRIHGFGYAFEAEILSEDNPRKIAAAQKKIGGVCAELGLRKYPAGGFEAQCDAINNTKKMQYDFCKTDPTVVKKKYSSFFR